MYRPTCATNWCSFVLANLRALPLREVAPRRLVHTVDVQALLRQTHDAASECFLAALTHLSLLIVFRNEHTCPQASLACMAA